MANQVRELFGVVPDDLETFALASQITQAEAKKYFIEMTRLRKWRTSGILWWNVIDGWPQFSDAVVDYYFERQAGLSLHPPRPAAGERDRGRAGTGQAPAADHQQRQPERRRRSLPSLGR